MINSIKNQLKETFLMKKRKNKDGLFNNIYIFPFITQSGAIISIQPLGIFRSCNGFHLDSAISQYDHTVLTTYIDSESWHIQIKSNDDVEYLETDSSDEVLNLFKKYGGVDVVGTITLSEIYKQWM